MRPRTFTQFRSSWKFGVGARVHRLGAAPEKGGRGREPPKAAHELEKGDPAATHIMKLMGGTDQLGLKRKYKEESEGETEMDVASKSGSAELGPYHDTKPCSGTGGCTRKAQRRS